MVTALGRGQARPSVVTGNTIYDCSSLNTKGAATSRGGSFAPSTDEAGASSDKVAGSKPRRFWLRGYVKKKFSIAQVTIVTGRSRTLDNRI